MKHYIHITLLLLLLVFPVMDVMGQLGYPVRKFATEHGLQYGIINVAQDASGFIWLKGNNEVQRFDGKHTNIWFKGEKPYSLLIDSRENVWVTTRKGVFRFDRQKDRFSEVTIEEAAVPKIIFEPEKGKLLCISANGIYMYDEASKKFVLSSVPSLQLKPKAQVSSLKFSHSNHTLYYCAGDTIWRHDMQTGKADKTTFQRIHNVLALSEEEIIVSSREKSTSSWYYNFSTGQRLRLSVVGADPFLHIYDVLAMDNNNYYLGTARGLVSYTPGTTDLHRVHLSFEGKPLPVEKYYGLYKGKKGAVWACTRSSLFRFNPSGTQINFIQKNVTDPVSWFNHSHNVRGFAEDEEGNLWLATHDGLTRWDTKNNHFSTIMAEENAKDRLNHPTINGLVYDGTYLIIGQVNNGVWLYNPKTKTFKRPVFSNDEEGRSVREKIEKSFIHEIETLKNGDHIITAGGGGAYLMNGENYSIEAISFPGYEPHVEFCYQDAKGDIFIGTYNGLYCFDASLRYQYHVKEELETRWIRCMLQQGNGYYLGTEKGLYFFSKHNDTFAVKKVAPALHDKSIRILFEDDNNTVWVAMESKVHQYFPKTGHLNTYGYSENIYADSFHPNSYIRRSNGQVFIGSENGIHYFYPERIDPYPEKLYPYIRDVTIREYKDSITDFGNTKRLKRYQNTMNVGFSTPYYGSSDAINYRYQLTENGEWYDHGNRSNLTLWKLPPGKYQLRIAASLSDGVWHTSEDTFRFTILPPFWKTWWFFLGISILGCIALYRVFVSFQQKLKMEKLLNVFATSLYGHTTVGEILQNTVRNCTELLGLSSCAIYEVDKKKKLLIRKTVADVKNDYSEEDISAHEVPLGKDIIGTVAVSGRSKRVGNMKKYPNKNGDKVLSEIAVPLWIDGEVFGVINSKHPKTNFYTRFHIRLMEKIAGVCGDRIQKYLTEEKLRGKIARDLHDEMGSTLTSIHIISKMSEQKLQDNAPLKKQLTRINDHTSDMIEKMSDMVWVVNPANDDLDKLMYKIREYAEEVLESKNISISFLEIENAQHIKLNPEQRKNIYLIAKETLNNVVKYSDATQVMLLFKEENNTLKMQISDNGKGYDSSVSHSGNGVKNMYVRAQEINAVLEVNTTPGEGVSLLLSLAVERKQPV